MTIIKSAFIVIIALIIISEKVRALEDKKFWREAGKADLKAALELELNKNIAKNVIIFIGDGMSMETITATRIYNGGEESYLSWEKFPHVGLLKTYNVDKQVPDSASTATAIFCGVKTNNDVSGVDANVPLGDCEASLNEDYHLDSVIAWGQAAGKDTGFVTTARVTHATPSALYAHTAHRSWECEQRMPESARKCKDHARQLIEDNPGRNIKVIMGGGRQLLQSNITATDDDPIDTWACYRQDGRKLIDEWSADKSRRKFSNVVVKNTEELSQVDTENTDFLLGIFSNGHISMDWERNKGPRGQPSLENMTTTAIKVLQKSEKGFVLVVEAGMIDMAHHRGHAAQALLETLRLSEAVSATLKLVDISETLVIVTSDHGHALTFNGVSKRGSNILGIAQNSIFDNIPYTTLGYSTGGPNNIAYEAYNATVAVRKDPSGENTTAFTYSQQAGVISDEAKHSGADVPIYAIGPHAHLFQSTHEQSFVAHAVAYSAKIGEYYSSHGPSVRAYSILLIVMATLPFL